MAARPQCRILGRPSKPGARLPSWLLGTVRCNFRTCMEPGLSSCGMKVPAGIRSGKRFTKSDTEALKRLLGVCRGADRLGARVFFHDVFWKLAVEQLLAEAPEVPHDCPCPCLYHAVHERLHHDSICLVPQYYRDDVVNHGKVVINDIIPIILRNKTYGIMMKPLMYSMIKAGTWAIMRYLRGLCKELFNGKLPEDIMEKYARSKSVSAPAYTK